jgi:Putative N-acetylmannosamine-6-phosphate epimerase
METFATIESIKGNLVVSCQASSGEPLNHKTHILAMSLSALNGGAGGLRLEGVENIAFVREFVDINYKGHVPIIGLTKSELSAEQKLNTAYITASYVEAAELARAGADIIALDATGRRRLDNLSLKETVEKIHSELNVPVWADCSTFSEGLAAAEAGCDVVSTTLYGYTAETELPKEHGPGLSLLKEFVTHLKVPVILEGRVWTPAELTEAFELGAHAVVVGSAITRPQLITERFVKAIPRDLVSKPVFQHIGEHH